MSNETDTRDRVIRMETEMHSLKDKVDQIDKKVDEIHDILMQARGARTTINVLVWLSGTSLFVWIATYGKNILEFFRPH